MVLALACGCLEPAADGVGDYTRLLAAAFVRAGWPTRLIALHDPHVEATAEGMQKLADLSLPVLRLPVHLPWERRIALARDFLRQGHCRLLSLQFVPFAFAARGLPWLLPGVIQRLLAPLSQGGQPLALHLMFHEIWVGIARSSSWRERALGRLQRTVIADLCRRCTPLAVHTSNMPYQLCLQAIGIPAVRLPLYSNLPSPDPSSLPPSLPHAFTACVFGRIPPQWDPRPILPVLRQLAHAQGQLPRLLLLGRSHAPAGWVEQLRASCPDLLIESHGIEPSPARMAALIQACQLGLATSPWALIEKSGAVAAFLQLGLPVLVSREDWHLRQRWARGETLSSEPHTNLYPLSYYSTDLADPGRQVSNLYPPGSVETIAERLISLFEKLA